MIGGFERALVIGLGKSGRASVRILRGLGAAVSATDEGEPGALGPALQEL